MDDFKKETQKLINAEVPKDDMIDFILQAYKEKQAKQENGLSATYVVFDTTSMKYDRWDEGGVILHGKEQAKEQKDQNPHLDYYSVEELKERDFKVYLEILERYFADPNN